MRREHPPKKKDGRGRPPRSRLLLQIAWTMARLGMPRRAIQAHLSEHLEALGKRPLRDKGGADRGERPWHRAGSRYVKDAERFIESLPPAFRAELAKDVGAFRRVVKSVGESAVKRETRRGTSRREPRTVPPRRS